MPVSQAPRKKQATRKKNAKKADQEAQAVAQTKYDKTPLYIPVATFVFIITGIGVVILNFLEVLPGKTMQTQFSIIGVLFLSLGLIAATQIK